MAAATMSMTKSLSRTGLSRSSPSLITAASFNLREFSTSRKRLSVERPDSALDRRNELGEIDLIGGNGHWRQRKAKHEFERRRIEEDETRREQEKREAERRHRQELRDEQRRKQQAEEEAARAADQVHKRERQLEKERLKLEHEEKERVRKELEEHEWKRRQPVTCQTCDGCGGCQVCAGKGEVFGVYLVSQTGNKSLFTNTSEKDYGKLTQGCTNCGGYKHGVRGDLNKGSGKCPPCGGQGKIWPKLDLSAMCPKSREMHKSWAREEEVRAQQIIARVTASPKIVAHF